jgi:hypothetical protein
MGLTPGDILRDGVRSVQRNQWLIIAFAAACAGLDLAVRLVEWPLIGFDATRDIPPWAANVDLLIQMVYVALYAALVAVVFARLGKDIDRPLWKCGSSAEALRRFFALWLIINLYFLMLYRLQRVAIMHDNEDVAIFLELLVMISYIVAFPAGTCIMYAGKLDWAQLGPSLRPLTRKFDLAFPVLAINFGGYVLLTIGMFIGAEVTAIAGRLLIPGALSFAMALLDGFVFCAMWRVCMVHRDEPDTDDEDLF